MTVPELIVELLDTTGYLADLKNEGTVEAESRLENLQELVSAARDFMERSEDRSLQAFLDSVALIADIDEMVEGTGAVTLMTLHSAKGLEFPVVFMTGMEEGVFPHARASERRRRAGGGAAAVLRGHDPGQGAVVSHRRTVSPAVQQRQL